MNTVYNMVDRILRSNSFVICLAFIIVRTIPFLMYLGNFGVQIAPDSETYRVGFWDWSVLGNHRGYGITIPFTLCPNDFFIAGLQFGLVTTSGVLLIREFHKNLSKYKYLPIACIFIVLCSPTIAVWDTWVLSHSLTIAYNLFSFVFLLRYRESGKYLHLSAFSGFLFFSSISRPNNQAVLVIALTFIAFYLVFNFLRNKEQLFKLIGILLVFVSIISLSVGLNSNSARKSNPSSTIAILPYLLDVTAPISGDLIREMNLDSEIPRCAYPSQPLINGNAEYFNNFSENCPEGFAWLETNFHSWYTSFLIRNPDASLKALSYGVGVGLGYPINYGDVYPSFIAEPILKLFVGAPKVSTSKPGVYPLFGWMLLVFFTFLQLAIRRRNSQTSVTKGNLKIQVFVYLAWIMSSVVSLVYLSHSDAFRVFVDNQVILIIISVYLFSLNSAELWEYATENKHIAKRSN